MSTSLVRRSLAALSLLLAGTSFAAVDVNQASAADLDGIKGIGPATSSRILDERQKGRFKDWGDLISRVGGIGEKSAARLSEGGLTVNGTPFSRDTTGSPAAAASPAPGKPARPAR